MLKRFAQICFFSCLLIGFVSCAGRRGHAPSPEEVERLNFQRARAVQLIDRGDFHEAIEILNTVLEKVPDDASALGMLAWAQGKTGSASEAVRNFEASLRLDYSNYLTHFRFAKILMEMGKTGRALTEFELAVRYGKNEPLPHYSYGLALYKRNRKQDALIEWQLAYDLDNHDPRFAEAMGIGLAGTDDRAALVYFEKADSLGMQSASFRHNYALLLQRLGRYNTAEMEFQRAVKAAPDNLSYRFDLAAFYMNRELYEKAIPLWKKLIEQSPGETSYCIYLARAYLELERFAETISVLDPFEEAARGGKPDDGVGDSRAPVMEPARLSEAFGILAMSHRGEGNLDLANFYIRKALEIEPQNVEHLINYGVILADRGNIGEARIQWRRALEIEPENEVARQNLSAFER